MARRGPGRHGWALWVAERSILLLCATVVHIPATAYARALNHAAWRELAETTVTDHLEQHKAAFLASARDSLT